jgi:branched-chain amino acid transport system permease protein
MHGFLASLLTFSFLTLISVCGTFVLTGLTGLFSFGQGGFMMLGAYVSAVANMRYGVPFPLAVALGVAAVIVLAVLMGIPTLRLRRDYFALVTFALGEALQAIFIMFTQFTGGTMGMGGIPRKTNFWIALGCAAACVWMVANLKRSRLGRIAIAIRNDELAAQAMGINVYACKMVIFTFSAALAGLGGCLTAFFINYMEPNLFGWTTAVEQIIIVFFGGINSLTGAVASTFLLGLLPETLRFAAAWRMILYAVIIILVINLRPQGLFGTWELRGASLGRAWKRIRPPALRPGAKGGAGSAKGGAGSMKGGTGSAKGGRP